MDNPIASITNQLKVDIDIFDVFNTSDSPKEPKYEYTKLGSVAAGQTSKIQTRHFASQLQAMISGKETGLDDNYYKNFPVSVFGVSPLGNHTEHTVMEDEQAGTVQAFRFIKYSSANGNSKLARQFMDALSVDKDQSKAVDAFFAGTGSFNKCSFHAWTTVMAYMNNFTSPWQGSYYFYTQPSAAGEAVKLMGIMSIADGDKSDQAVMTMANQDNTIPKIGAQTVTLKVADDGTFTESEVGVSPVSVNLKGLWMNVISADPKTHATRYLIGAAFTGTIAGVKVIGTGQMRELPKSQADQMKEKEKEQKAAERERQFDRMWSKVISIVGLTINMFMLFVMVKQMKQHEGSKSSKVENDAAEKGTPDEKEVKGDQEKAQAEYEAETKSRVKPETEKLAAEMEELPKVEAEAAETAKLNATETMLDEQVDKMTEVLESEPPTNALEETAESLMDAQSKLADGQVDEARNVLEKTDGQVEKALADGEGHAAEYETDALTDVRDAIAENEKISSEIEKAQAERKAESEADPSEEMDPDAFDDPMEDPIEDFPIGGGE